MDNNQAPDVRRSVIAAAITAVLVACLFKFVLDWGVIPAIIGGGSVGVIWFYINKAFAGRS